MRKISKAMLLGGVALNIVSLGTSVAFAQNESAIIPAPTPIINEAPSEVMSDDALNLLPEENGAPRPDNTALDAPAVAPAIDMAAPAAIGESGLTPSPMVNDVDDNVFYDANALVPEGELGRQAPRKMDPRMEPASRLITVTKNAGANSHQARLTAASRALKLGRDSSALEIYNELYSKNKRDPNVLMGRAIALQKLGLIEESVGAYEELLTLRPKDVQARVNMLGMVGERYPEVAMRQLKDLRNNNPDNVGLVAQMGIIDARLGNFDSGLRYMGVAASMEPNNANHFYNLAIIADQGGYTKEAVKYYEKSLEVDSIYGGGRTIPRKDVYTRLAQIR